MKDMNQFNSEWWSICLPDDWTIEQDNTCITMFSESGFGALQISASCNNNGSATDDDLREFAQEHIDAGASLEPIICGEFTGFYLHYSIEEVYQREWWLRCGNTVVLATYTSDIEDKGNEDKNMNNILNTLKKIDDNK